MLAFIYVSFHRADHPTRVTQGGLNLLYQIDVSRCLATYRVVQDVRHKYRSPDRSVEPWVTFIELYAAHLRPKCGSCMKKGGATRFEPCYMYLLCISQY